MKLRTEATTTYNAIDKPDWLNPRGAPAKTMEMACRRAAALDRLIAQYERDNTAAATRPPGREYAKLAEQATGMVTFWHHPIWDHRAWPWVYQHWKTGGLQRNATVLSSMLPAENLARYEKEIA